MRGTVMSGPPRAASSFPNRSLVARKLAFRSPIGRLFQAAIGLELRFLFAEARALRPPPAFGLAHMGLPLSQSPCCCAVDSWLLAQQPARLVLHLAANAPALPPSHCPPASLAAPTPVPDCPDCSLGRPAWRGLRDLWLAALRPVASGWPRVLPVPFFGSCSVRGHFRLGLLA